MRLPVFAIDLLLFYANVLLPMKFWHLCQEIVLLVKPLFARNLQFSAYFISHETVYEMHDLEYHSTRA